MGNEARDYRAELPQDLQTATVEDIQALAKAIGCRASRNRIAELRLDGACLASFDSICELLIHVDSDPSESVEWLRLFSTVKNTLRTNSLEPEDLKAVSECAPEAFMLLTARHRFTAPMLIEIDPAYFCHVLGIKMCQLKHLKDAAVAAYGHRRTLSSV